MIVLLWVLNALDVVTTRAVLEQGGVEMNPLVAPFADSTLQLSAVKLVVLGAYTALRPPRWATAALCLLYVAVVASNLSQIL